MLLFLGRLFWHFFGHPTNEWHEGSFATPEDSRQAHFAKHGREVGATSVDAYSRKARAFRASLRGARRSSVQGFTVGVIRYRKNGRYIDLAEDGRIISFGAVDHGKER